MKKIIIAMLMLSFIMTQAACAKSLGEIAPDFTLNATNGKTITLSKINKPVLLDFWATWCPPCRKEAPRVQEFYERYKGGVEVIGINVNESKAAVTDFSKKLSLTYTMALDSGKVAKEYGVVAIPTIVLIGTDKKILYTGHSVHEAEQYLP